MNLWCLSVNRVIRGLPDNLWIKGEQGNKAGGDYCDMGVNCR
jgi:hypothetical protein